MFDFQGQTTMTVTYATVTTALDQLPESEAKTALSNNLRRVERSIATKRAELPPETFTFDPKNPDAEILISVRDEHEVEADRKIIQAWEQLLTLLDNTLTTQQAPSETDDALAAFKIGKIRAHTSVQTAIANRTLMNIREAERRVKESIELEEHYYKRRSPRLYRLSLVLTAMYALGWASALAGSFVHLPIIAKTIASGLMTFSTFHTDGIGSVLTHTNELFTLTHGVTLVVGAIIFVGVAWLSWKMSKKTMMRQICKMDEEVPFLNDYRALHPYAKAFFILTLVGAVIFGLYNTSLAYFMMQQWLPIAAITIPLAVVDGFVWFGFTLESTMEVLKSKFSELFSRIESKWSYAFIAVGVLLSLYGLYLTIVECSEALKFCFKALFGTSIAPWILTALEIIALLSAASFSIETAIPSSISTLESLRKGAYGLARRIPGNGSLAIPGEGEGLIVQNSVDVKVSQAIDTGAETLPPVLGAIALSSRHGTSSPTGWVISAIVASCWDTWCSAAYINRENESEAVGYSPIDRDVVATMAQIRHDMHALVDVADPVPQAVLAA